MITCFKDQVKLTGKCNDFHWIIEQAGLDVMVRNNECVVSKHDNQLHSYHDYLDVLLLVNNYYHSPRWMQHLFVLDNKHTSHTNRLFKSLTWYIQPLSSEQGKATALVYQSGKFVLLGCRSQQQVIDTINFIIKTLITNGIIQQHQLPERKIPWNISNIVKAGRILPPGSTLQLSALYKYLLQERGSDVNRVVYEQELFPSLKCMIHDVTCLVFSTSSFILTGSSNEVSLEKVFNLLSTIIKDFDTKHFVEELIAEFNHGIY